MNDTLPPLIRRRDVLKKFRNLSAEELVSWEDCGLIQPFRKNPTARRWYRTEEIEKILRGPQAA